MNPIFIYPGSFSPPTYGHLDIVKQAAKLAPKLIIICSINDEKNGLFTPEESKKLWLSYTLPDNVEIMTFEEFVSAGVNSAQITMVRGIRDSQDFDYEKKVAFQNHDNFGLNKFLYIMSSSEFEGVSSTAARTAAIEMRLTDLRKLVSARVATALLEKTLHIRNLILVVGRPGSGKSTFLRQLSETDPRNIHIDTDRFNHDLKPLLRQIFQEEDLIKIALTKEEELKAVIAAPWTKLLAEALRAVPSDSNVFVETPYAFKPGMNLYKLLGGKTIYFDCGEKAENERRLRKRGTPHLNPFITTIPDWPDTKRLADEEDLQIARVNTKGSLLQLNEKVAWLANRLNQPVLLFPFAIYGDSEPYEDDAPHRNVPSLSFRNRSYLRKVGD